MFGEIKKMLGIEDVKISLECPDKIKKVIGEVEGAIQFTTFKDSQVHQVELKLIERYERGRKESKLIDEYVLGELILDCDLEVKKQDIINLPFVLPFKPYHSEMDTMQNNNLILGGIVSIAKLVKGVKSSYRIEAIARVKGTKLHPQAVKEIILE